MNVATFDTHEMVKELMAAGFSDEQAEAVTRLLRRSQDIDFSHLATKSDLQTELAAMRAEIVQNKTELKAEIAETKAEIIKWMFGTIGFQTLIILGAVIALARLLQA